MSIPKHGDDSGPHSSPEYAGPRLTVREVAAEGLGPLSLTLTESECVGLHGPSGAGKSRLLRVIADLDPHTGAVDLYDMPRSRLRPPEWRRRVALLPAESHWWMERVSDHFGGHDGIPLSELDLDQALLDSPVSRLSSGERQRFALLRILANAPDVLLLDEPTANLDPANAQRVESAIERYRHDTGAAVLWVGHDDLQLQRVASRVLEIRHGHLQETGPAPA